VVQVKSREGKQMDTPQIVLAVIVIVVVGGIVAVWFRRRQSP